MISRTFASILPLQSPSSLILASSTPDADSAGMVSFIYNSNLAPTLATLSVTCNLRTEAPSGLISSSEGWWQGNADWPARCGHSGWESAAQIHTYSSGQRHHHPSSGFSGWALASACAIAISNSESVE